MILKIFAVRDSQVEAFLQPFFSPTTGAALRSLTEAINDPKHDFHKHAKDYSLWELADFDDSTGVISTERVNPPIHVINCFDLQTKIING